MRICFKTYKRRDGSFMIYVNNHVSISIGISPNQGYGPLQDLSKHQKKLIRVAGQALAQHGQTFTGNIEQHQDKTACADYVLAWSINGEIGGHPIDRDGAYVIAWNRILPCERWFLVTRNGVQRRNF